MSESIKKYDTGYTQVLNKVLLDENLSLKAKGLYAYLFSKPDGWQFHIDVMEKELKESKGQIRTIIKELLDLGYIERKQVNENGVFGGIVYEFIKQNDIEKPCTEKPAYGNTLTHNNIYNLNNTYNLKKENNKKKKFSPPTLEDVKEYSLSRNRPDLAEKFYDYFNATDWVDSNGKEVKNWKGKFITWESHTAKPQETKKDNWWR